MLVAWWTQAQLPVGGGIWALAAWLLALAVWTWATRRRRSGPMSGE